MRRSTATPTIQRYGQYHNRGVPIRPIVLVDLATIALNRCGKQAQPYF
jgi:hypothetical protein